MTNEITQALGVREEIVRRDINALREAAAKRKPWGNPAACTGDGVPQPHSMTLLPAGASVFGTPSASAPEHPMRHAIATMKGMMRIG